MTNQGESCTRRRLLYFLNSLVVGGVERHVLDLIRRVNRDQFDMRLVCPPTLAQHLRSDLNELDVEIDEIEIRSWRQVGEIRRFKQLLRDWQPDIVHSHLYLASRYASPIARLARVPGVLETAHIEENWRIGWRKHLALLDGIASRFANEIIAVSHAVKRFYVEVKRVPAEKIVVVHNGIDIARFDPDEARDVGALRNGLGIGPDEKVACIVGRLDDQKGHRFLLEAGKAVFESVPNARFVFAGRGPLEDSLKKLASDLTIAERVVFAGFRSDVANIYALSDVVVLPSLFEGLPLTVAEALAMRRPVVATSVSGTPEILLDGQTGFLVPSQEPVPLAKALISLLNNPELSRDFGQRGREHVCEHFSLKQQVEHTEDIYMQTLGAS